MELTPSSLGERVAETRPAPEGLASGTPADAHQVGRRDSGAGSQVPGGLISLPDEDDDRGRLRHRPNHAADTHHAQEGEEGLLAPGTGAFSGNHRRVLGWAGQEARAAGEILKGSIQPF